MQETKEITAVLDAKPKKFVSLYHVIWDFMNMRQGKTDPNYALSLRFEQIYEIMELAGGDNIICSKKLTKNKGQE